MVGMSNATAYIKINGTRLYLASTRPGMIRTADGLSEQCQDCARDIVKHGTIQREDPESRCVQCDCGTTYTIHGKW